MPPIAVLIIHSGQDSVFASTTGQVFQATEFEVQAIDLEMHGWATALLEPWDYVVQIVSSSSVNVRGLAYGYMAMTPSDRLRFESRSAAMYLVFEKDGKPELATLDEGQAIGWQRWRVSESGNGVSEIRALASLMRNVQRGREMFKRRNVDLQVSHDGRVSLALPLRRSDQRGIGVDNTFEVGAVDRPHPTREHFDAGYERQQRRYPWWTRMWNRFLTRSGVPIPLLDADLTADEVHFTVTAPASIAPGGSAELIIWAHLREDDELVARKAMVTLAIPSIQRLLSRSVGPVAISKGTVISVFTQLEDLAVANPHSRMLWSGSLGCTNVIVTVPKNAHHGTRRGTSFISLNGVEVARIDFLLLIGRNRRHRKELSAEINRYRRAFASYASEDRDAVLMHVHGMRKIAVNLNVFVDVVSLRSGDDWAQELYKAITGADVFYLFWCRHALRSEWVQREWRWAYDTRGSAFINPVPLESPEAAPPPPELSGKQFNDPLLSFLKTPHLD
jgi:hypothetical protein